MSSLTAALTFEASPEFVAMVESIAAAPAVSRLVLLGSEPQPGETFSRQAFSKIDILPADLFSGVGMARLLEAVRTDYLMIVLPGERVRFSPEAIGRLLRVAEDSEGGLLYSDFKDERGGETSDHPLVDYQLGSIRDSFDFGPAFIVSRPAANAAFSKYGAMRENLRWGALYDLRLKLSIDSAVLRIPEPLYRRRPVDAREMGERQFDYVDPQRREHQREMEEVATAHLKRIRAYLEPEFQEVPRASGGFPVHASVVIPVRNRERTIGDAVRSALSQKALFDFNVIVVDNHSGDGTTGILPELAKDHENLIHLIPDRTDLGIGGCWNEAVCSSHCGIIAAQLDSDDLYSDEHSLEKLVAKFDEGSYAMVIGSYKVVNFDLKEIPPGLIDHREWTRENGRNNALRVNGLGAPRAFYVPLLRQTGFPNTSYGEDYAVGLRISRQYEIGRIYEPIYFARRWEGNSDAQLDLATSNRYDAYKDHLRTIEILARKRMNQR